MVYVTFRKEKYITPENVSFSFFSPINSFESLSFVKIKKLTKITFVVKGVTHLPA